MQGDDAMSPITPSPIHRQPAQQTSANASSARSSLRGASPEQAPQVGEGFTPGQPLRQNQDQDQPSQAQALSSATARHVASLPPWASQVINRRGLPNAARSNTAPRSLPPAPGAAQAQMRTDNDRLERSADDAQLWIEANQHPKRVRPDSPPRSTEQDVEHLRQPLPLETTSAAQDHASQTHSEIIDMGLVIAQFKGDETTPARFSDADDLDLDLDHSLGSWNEGVQTHGAQGAATRRSQDSSDHSIAQSDSSVEEDIDIYPTPITSRPDSNEQYLAHWTEWVGAGGPEGGDRTAALARMKALMELQTDEPELNLVDLGLTTLPTYLHHSLTVLKVSFNKLHRLPNDLPPKLTRLEIAQNYNFRSLPELPDTLTFLSADDCKLETLPKLPPNLNDLRLESNRLTSLDINFPRSLTHLDVSDNLISSFPTAILRGLNRDCEIHIHGNSLGEEELGNIFEEMGTPGYNGPIIDLYNPSEIESESESISSSSSSSSSEVSDNELVQDARELKTAVTEWYSTKEEKDAAQKAWKKFSNEENSEFFSIFLDRLKESINGTDPDFTNAVSEWLSHLVQHADLRATSFATSYRATSSCQDRVSLTYNQMKKARLTYDVQIGLYDKNLPKLIDLGRQMFRLDQLEIIAHNKAKSLKKADTIEVYLAYQIKLRKKLNLPIDTVNGKYLDSSQVTGHEIKWALNEVLELEKNNFMNYLSVDWEPWKAVCQRLDKSGFEATQNELIEAMGDIFEARKNARIQAFIDELQPTKETAQPDQFKIDEDTKTILSAEVKNEITREIMGKFTTDLLKNHGLIDPLK